MQQLSLMAPIELHQMTPVRVLKRRPLIDRLRNIFEMSAFAIDDRRFCLRLLYKISILYNIL